jgi:ABC-2 type transport system permease protein
MAINKHTYKDYEGSLTAAWMRFVILSRFFFSPLFQSKFLVLFMTVCLFYPVGCAVYIYISQNSLFVLSLNFRPGLIPPIDGTFFYTYCWIQGSMAVLLTTLIGPNLIAPDLANGALCLYLSRPLSRVQYILGKMVVLLSIQSLITWVPGLLLFAIQTGVKGFDWAADNSWLIGSIIIGMGLWIIILSLIAMALSAWVKWKIAAGALFLGVFFAGAGFGNAINNILRTRYGSIIDLSNVIHTIWAYLFRHGFMDTNLSTSQAWIVLGVTCVLCLTMLFKRIRAFEVVK